MRKFNIILASASPRRQELLHLIMDDFGIAIPDVDERAIEDSNRHLGVKKLSSILALEKARKVYEGLSPEKKDETIVIGADTSVILDDEIMGKPGDIEEARQMLTKLSGHTHSVITGVAIVSRNVFFDFFEESLVEFGPLDSYQTELIEKYIHSNEPYDKAGGYGIQGGGALLVKEIKGDYFNVMGLPVYKLARKIDEFI